MASKTEILEGALFESDTQLDESEREFWINSLFQSLELDEETEAESVKNA